MKTARERVVELHNQSVDKTAIAREVGITPSEVETKLAQSRRAGIPVRPDGMSVEDFKKQFPRAASAGEAEVARAVARAETPRKDATPDAVRDPKAPDLVELARAWNQNPDTRMIARRFGFKVEDLQRLVSRLRAQGVLLKYPNQIANLDAIKAAALQALTPEEAAELRNRIANRRKARVHKLPQESSQNVKQA